MIKELSAVEVPNTFASTFCSLREHFPEKMEKEYDDWYHRTTAHPLEGIDAVTQRVRTTSHSVIPLLFFIMSAAAIFATVIATSSRLASMSAALEYVGEGHLSHDLEGPAQPNCFSFKNLR